MTQGFLEGTTTHERLQAIGRKHGLHVDQLGALSEEILAVVDGTRDREDFIDRIEERLSLDTEKAIAVATDVNLEIFKPLRKEVMGRGNQPHPVTDAAPEESREAILAEIEDPLPSRPTSEAQNEGAAKSFIGNRLSAATNSVAKTATAPAAQQQTQKAKSYAVDPYREPIA